MVYKHTQSFPGGRGGGRSGRPAMQVYRFFSGCETWKPGFQVAQPEKNLKTRFCGFATWKKKTTCKLGFGASQPEKKTWKLGLGVSVYFACSCSGHHLPFYHVFLSLCFITFVLSCFYICPSLSTCFKFCPSVCCHHFIFHHLCFKNDASDSGLWPSIWFLFRFRNLVFRFFQVAKPDQVFGFFRVAKPENLVFMLFSGCATWKPEALRILRLRLVAQFSGFKKDPENLSTQ